VWADSIRDPDDFLSWLYDHPGGSVDDFVDEQDELDYQMMGPDLIGQVATRYYQFDWGGKLNELQHEGLVSSSEGELTLTPAGQDRVHRLREAQAEREIARRATDRASEHQKRQSRISGVTDPQMSLREQFLDWLYDNPNAHIHHFKGSEEPAEPIPRPYLPDPTNLIPKEQHGLGMHSAGIPAPPLGPVDPWTQIPRGTSPSWQDRLKQLRHEGLVTLAASDNLRATLTATGKEVVEQRRTEQERRRRWRQKPAAMKGLLLWLSERDLADEQWSRVDQVLKTRHAYFAGERLSEGSFRQAAEYLQEKGLIRGESGATEGIGPLTARITHQGQDCVQAGGNVADYLHRRREPAPSSTYIGPVFQGDVHGAQLAWNNGGPVTQNQQVASGHEALAEAITNVLRSLPTMGLTPEAEEDAEAAGNDILAEVVRHEPRPGPIRRSLTVIRDALTAIAVGGAAGAAAGVSDGAQEAARSALERLASF
jgi:hypothetical protein